MALYRATFDERWFEQAHGLTRSMIAGFGRDGGGFYDTSAEHESLVVRPRSLQDSPTPSGNSLAATVLLRLAALTGEGRYWDLATETLRQAAPPAGRAPSVFGQWLSAHYLADVGITEVAVVGDLNGPDAVAMTSVLARTYLPRVVVAARRGETPSSIAVLDGREPPAGVEAAAWVCRGQVCSTAIADPAELLERLGPPRPASPAA
jgi:uncharacterized protein YyaL (SSP411 family)